MNKAGELAHRLFDCWFRIGTLLDDKGYWPYEGLATGDVTESCFALFAHFAAADGMLARQEVDLWNHFWEGVDQTADEVLECCQLTLTSEPHYLTTVPYHLSAAVEFDIQNSTALAATTVGVMLDMARLIMSCDAEDSPEEYEMLTEYELVLEGYLRQNNVPIRVEDGDDDSVCSAESNTSEQRVLAELLEELEELVGLASVKQDVLSLINFIKVRQMRESQGIKCPPMSLHLVFTGNPGTGKTTVARLLAEIYSSLGLLSKGHLVETDRSGLVGGYVGQTALKVQELVASALGGVLFVDEAYSLISGRGDSDYGREAIDALIKLMEDNRDNLIVIVAGYTDKMQEFLESNPGMASRFNKYLHFEDYSAEELYQIFELMCRRNDCSLVPECAELARRLLSSQYDSRDTNFGNARMVRNFFERTFARHADRIAAKLPHLSEQDLVTIYPEDLPAGEMFA